jgi:hypothetical protein
MEVGLYMGKDNDEIKRSLMKFYDLLEECPDDANSALVFLDFLKSFLRVSALDPLPSIEVMTLIKEYKPAVFYTLKRLGTHYRMVGILTELSMDLRVAEKKLEVYGKRK